MSFKFGKGVFKTNKFAELLSFLPFILLQKNLFQIGLTQAKLMSKKSSSQVATQALDLIASELV